MNLAEESPSSYPQSKFREDWSFPPLKFIKINFYGTLKVILDPLGLVGVFKESFDHILRFFMGFMVIIRNNFVELVYLERGLIIATTHGYDRLTG